MKDLHEYASRIVENNNINQMIKQAPSWTVKSNFGQTGKLKDDETKSSKKVSDKKPGDQHPPMIKPKSNYNKKPGDQHPDARDKNDNTGSIRFDPNIHGVQDIINALTPNPKVPSKIEKIRVPSQPNDTGYTKSDRVQYIINRLKPKPGVKKVPVIGPDGEHMKFPDGTPMYTQPGASIDFTIKEMASNIVNQILKQPPSFTTKSDFSQTGKLKDDETKFSAGIKPKEKNYNTIPFRVGDKKPRKTGMQLPPLDTGRPEKTGMQLPPLDTGRPEKTGMQLPFRDDGRPKGK